MEIKANQTFKTLKVFPFYEVDENGNSGNKIIELGPGKLITVEEVHDGWIQIDFEGLSTYRMRTLALEAAVGDYVDIYIPTQTPATNDGSKDRDKGKSKTAKVLVITGVVATLAVGAYLYFKE